MGTPARVTRLSSGNPTHNIRGDQRRPAEAGRRTCFLWNWGAGISRLELYFLAGDAPTLGSEGSVFWPSLKFQVVVHATPQPRYRLGEISGLEAIGRQAGRQGLLLSRGQVRRHSEPGTAGVSGLVRDTQIPEPGCCRFAGRSQNCSRQIKARGRTQAAWAPLSSAFLGRSLKWLSPSHTGKAEGPGLAARACPVANPSTQGPRGPEWGRDLPRRSPQPPVSACRRRVTQGDD